MIRNVARTFGLPSDFFFDDHWLVEPAETSEYGMGLLKWIFKCIGFVTESDKDQNSNKLVLLGIEFDLGKSPVTVGIPEIKKVRYSMRIDEILEKDELTPAEAGKIRGALAFALQYIFQQSGKADLYELVRRQYRIGPDNKGKKLGKLLKRSLRSLRGIVERAVPRTLFPRMPPGSHAILYTDGMQELTKSWGIGGVYSPPGAIGKPAWYTGEVPDKVKALWKVRKQQIINIEGYAILVGLHMWLKDAKPFTRIIGFCDNQSIWAMMCKGSAREADSRALVREILEFMEKRQLIYWGEWVESKANISDDPSRLGEASEEEKEDIKRFLARLGAIETPVREYPMY